ncbi:hypothetical protein GOBAR_DD19782 [Gossypium barbadense]|nr:hypothetical protein GOBAR_DD19782 [Gossypium barbadense]
MGEDPLKIPLVHVPFWVQIHEVPLGLFSRSLAMLLGNFIGVFLEYDASNLRKENRNFMRVRVQIDVRKPIRRKKQVMSNGVCSYIKFKYEKLSLFCFFCGRLGHNDSYCETKMTLGSDPIEMGWDLSLRAPSLRALSMNSIWLREEDEGGKGGGWMENRFRKMSSRNGISKDNKRNSLDPILGFNLEGRGTTMEKPEENSWLYKKYTLMDHYLEDEVLMGEEGKKRNRGEMEVQNTFPEDIARKILQIPLAETAHNDFQAWKGELSDSEEWFPATDVLDAALKPKAVSTSSEIVL